MKLSKSFTSPKTGEVFENIQQGKILSNKKGSGGAQSLLPNHSINQIISEYQKQKAINLRLVDALKNGL